jgi:predicted phosphoribosyltransferase
VQAVLEPLFADRREAGRELAAALESERGPGLVVVGLARGGVEVAAEVARVLDAPLDVVAVRKVGHPWQPEYGLGAVTPRGGVYVRGPNGLTDEQLAAIVETTRANAERLDHRLHADHPALDLSGRTALLVDDGLATGATIVAALRWARAKGASRVLAAVPVAAAQSLPSLQGEADEVVCPHPLRRFFAVGAWYRSFAQLDDQTVIDLLAENRERRGASSAGERAGQSVGRPACTSTIRRRRIR